MKKTVFIGILFIVLLIIIQSQIINAQSNELTLRENELLLEGTIWHDTRSDNLITLTLEFRNNGRIVNETRVPSNPNSSANGIDNYKWSREGNTIKIFRENNSLLGEGRYYTQTQRIMLTFRYSDGDVDVTLIPFQRHSVSSVPSTSSPNTNLLSPAQTQTQQPAQNTVPSTPILQTGRYAWSNSGVNMTMTLNTAGLVSAYLNNSSVGVWHGTYRINGNQLVITVTAATGDYANLRGQTYSYTIDLFNNQ